MALLQFQFYESYVRECVNQGEVFNTGAPGCSNPDPGRPERLCQDGLDFDGNGLGICPDRHISLLPGPPFFHTGQMRSDGPRWTEDLSGVSPSPSVIEILLSARTPDKILDQFVCQVEEIPFGNGYQGSQHPITPPNQGGPNPSLPTLSVNANFSNADPAIAFLEGTSMRLTASGGNIADWRYIILYIASQPNPTHVHDGPLVGFWDQGEPVTITDGQTHAFKFNLADLDVVGNILKVTRTSDPI